MTTITQVLNGQNRVGLRFNLRLLLLLILLQISAVVYGQVQSEECATPEPTVEQYLAYKASLDAFLSQQSLIPSQSNTSDEIYEIPVHLIVIFDSDGNPPFPNLVNNLQDCIENTNRNLNYVNRHLHPRIRFYICLVDQISDNDLYNRQGPSGIISRIRANHPHVDLPSNMINYILNNERFGVGSFPHGIKMPANYNLGVSALHEFGHYFGLYHTHQSTTYPCNGDGGTISLYPDHSPNLLCPPLGGIIPCADTDGEGVPNYGKCYADLIEDTPVDVFCSTSHYINNIDCIREVNGENHVYHPDYANAMSYWNNPIDTRSKLSAEQIQRVIDVFENPELGVPPFGGDMSNLVNEVMPDCDNVIIEGNYPPAAGYIDRVKYCSTSEEYIPTSFGNGYVLQRTGLAGTFERINEGIFPIRKEVIQAGVTTGFCDFSALISGQNGFTIPDWNHLRANFDVSVLDILFIRRHILGAEELPKPYYWIAADVNNSGTITTLDLILIQRVILGINNDFANVPPWRFVPKYALGENFNFAAQFHDNPFSAEWVNNGITHRYLTGVTNSYLGGRNNNGPNSFDNVIQFTIDRTAPYARDPDTWSFYAVKTGDVSSSLCEGENEEDTDFTVNIPSHPCLTKGVPVKLRIEFDQDVKYLEGLQLQLKIDTELFEHISLVENSEEVTSNETSGSTILSTNPSPVESRGGIIANEDVHFDKGITRLAWYNKGNDQSIVNISGGDTFLEFNVTPAKTICDLSNAFQLINSKFNMAVVGNGKYAPVVLKELALGVEVLPVSGRVTHHGILNVFPNPTSGNEINFRLSLGASDPVSVQLWDMYGNSSYTELGVVGNGELQLPAISAAGFMPGVVYYLIRMGAEVHSGYFVKI
jgi:hypothetical protein